MNDIEALNALDRRSLVRLAEMLESNLLTPPFSEVTLRNLIDEVHVGSVSDLLSGLSGERLSPNQLALVVGLSMLAGNLTPHYLPWLTSWSVVPM